MTNNLNLAVVVLIMIAGLLLFIGIQKSDKEEIEKWAEQSGYTVISSEMTEERTTYFRFGSFGYDREWAN